MARIRTIKPEFWSDDTITECSLSARLLFIGIWNFADDAGNLDRSHKQIKTRVFPVDNVNCEALIVELLSHELLIEYSVSEKKYLHIPGFAQHQLINRPSLPVVPGYEESLRTHGILKEHSLSNSKAGVSTHAVREGKGREGGESENSLSLFTPAASEPKPRRADKLIPFPDDFVLSESMRAQALGRFADCNADEMFEQFKAHHVAKGSRMKVWPAAWTTWLGNASKYGYPKTTNSGGGNGLQMLKLA